MIQEFSLENLSERIHYGKTKEYFQEVLSSYNNQNYRSAVVMLWSVAIYDLVYKLQYLVDLYEDASARIILDKITEIQNRDPKSASWESQLIEDTYKTTELLNPSEYNNLYYLQQQRHLSAHPTLNSNRELHTPNKETVRALIRNVLEDLLIKPPFYTQKIIDELLEDIAEATPLLNTNQKVKRYVESRYLSRLKPKVEFSIYRSLWKLVFRLENPKCSKNRAINLKTLEVIGNRNRDNIIDSIKGEVDYYSNISSDSNILNFLVCFLSKNPDIYELLSEDAKLKIQHNIEDTYIGKICGWFIKDSLESHYQELLSLIENDQTFELTDKQLKYLLEISDTEEWQHKFCCIVSAFYCKSGSYNEADSRFQQAILPYLELFNKEALLFLIQRAENNAQLYRRGRAIEDYKEIQKRLFKLCGEDLDLSAYPEFQQNVSIER